MAETVKHTPGPWKLDMSALTVTTSDAVEARIAEIDGDNCDWEQGEADARLIAAAPDMLAALKLIMEEKAPSYHDCIDDGLPKCAWCFAEEAITKAEGRS